MDLSAVNSQQHRRRRRVALGLALAAVVLVAVWAWVQEPGTWVAVGAALERVAAWVRGLGAGWFFAAFALLPGAGFPVSIFAFAAGSLFGPVLGLPAVLGLSGLSMAVSMSLSYGVARFVLRPGAVRLLGYLGYRVPEVPVGREAMFVLLVRLAPGFPYALQNLLLGVARVRFRVYLAVSWCVATGVVAAMIIFGDALMQGRGRAALVALGVVVLLAAGARWLRGRLAGRDGGSGSASAPGREGAGR
jgi:uncharacterized membrane protein YdjX (TVP38/TMEM64 family)